MKTITLDNTAYELTDERFERLLVSGAIIKAPNPQINEHYLDNWHSFSYYEVCMLIKGPEE